MTCIFHGKDCELEHLVNELSDTVRTRKPKVALIVLLVDTDEGGHSALSVDGMPEDLGAAFLEDAARYLRGERGEHLS